MKKLFNANYNSSGINFGLLLIRVTIGVLMAIIGYAKLSHFGEMAGSDFWAKNVNFLGLGGKLTLGLVVFAEFFCSVLLILGLATRLASVPLIICMGYILFVFNKGEIIQHSENGDALNAVAAYLLTYIAILFAGPGKWSVDGLISK